MKTIGMIVAVEMDAVLSKYGRAAGVETRGGFEVHRYEGGDFRLFIVNSGAGEIAAAAATELLMNIVAIGAGGHAVNFDHDISSFSVCSFHRHRSHGLFLTVKILD